MIVIVITEVKKISTARMNKNSKSTWLAIVEACCGMNGRFFRKLGRAGLPMRAVPLAPEHHQHEAAERQHRRDSAHPHYVHDHRAVFPARRVVVVAVERERIYDRANALLRTLHHC